MIKCFHLFTLILFLFSMNFCCGYKILIFSPTNSRSHMISNGRIADTLAKDGHEVTLLEAEFRVLSKDVKSAKIAKRLTLSGFDPKVFDAGQAGLVATTFGPPPGIWDQFNYGTEFFDAFNIQCDKMWEMHRETLLNLKNEKFDILMSEQLNLCGIGLQAALGIKTNIWISSCPLDDHMAYLLGVPTPLSYVPSIGELSVSDRMTLYERIRNILEFWKNIRSYYYGMRETDKIYQKHFGLEFPSVIELARKSALTFVLADEFLDFPRPILHNTIYVGGLGLISSKPEISEEYSLEMEKGEKGVIFFSFGTNVESTSLPRSFKKHFFEAISQLSDYHFIVKFEAGDKDAFEESKKAPNCKIVSWAPQPAILAHDRLKIFITHGGYNSLLESINYAKPLLLMPIFGDQWRNAKLVERNGFGIVFEKRDLLKSSESFVKALKEILNNSSYTEQSRRMQKLVKTKPLNATQRLLAYTRFVADNDGILPELQIVGSELNWFIYFNIDVFLVIFLVAVIIPIAILIISVKILKSFLSSTRNSEKQSTPRKNPISGVGRKVVGGRRY